MKTVIVNNTKTLIDTPEQVKETHNTLQNQITSEISKLQRVSLNFISI